MFVGITKDFEEKAKEILRENNIVGNLVGKNTTFVGPNPLDIIIYEQKELFYILYKKEKIIKLRNNFVIPTVYREQPSYIDENFKMAYSLTYDKFGSYKRISYETYELDDYIYISIGGPTLYEYREHSTKDEIVETVKRPADIRNYRISKKGIVKKLTKKEYNSMIRPKILEEVNLNN